MKTVEITADFSGYPNGKDERVFRIGEEPELANDYADLLLAKELAVEKGGKPTRKSPQPETGPDAGDEKDATK